MTIVPKTPARATLTACIIACDEAERLPSCLDSVAFCDEVVVVDSGSRDATVAIARAAGATVVEQPWRGFAAQRNVALDHAHGEWVLEIDADERVSPSLREEVEAFLREPPADVHLCGLPLRDVYLGRPLGLSSKYPRYRHRLFRRDRFRHDEERTVHEGIVPEGTVHPFTGDLVHLLAGSWREALSDTWRYARLEAGQLDPATPPRRMLANALVRPPVKLAYRLSVGGGWRDGWRGLARVGLECAGDAAAWLRVLRTRPAGTGAARPAAIPVPDGAGAAPARLPHVVGLACGAAACERAARWLGTARAGGADVALLAPGRVADGSGMRVRPLPHRGPISLARALDAEDQLRPIDVLVPFGRRARLLLAATPVALPGGPPERVDERMDPVTFAEGRRG